MKMLLAIRDELLKWLDRRHALDIVLLTALCLRLLSIPLLHLRGPSSDEGEYRYIAERVVEGRGFVDSNGTRSVRAPLFPILLAMLFLLPGNTVTAAYVCGALAGTLIVYLGYLLAKIVWADQHAALFAAALLALHPSLVMYSGLLLPETVYIVFVLLTFLLGVSSDNSVFAWIGFGLAAGCAALTKAVFLPFFILMIALRVFQRSHNGVHTLAGPVFAVVVFLLVLLPWTMRNYAIHGAVVPISTFSGPSFLLGQNPFSHGTTKLDPGFDAWVDNQIFARTGKGYNDISEADWSALSWRIGAAYVREHPARWMSLIAEKAYAFLIYPISYSDRDIPAEAVAVGADGLVWLLLCLAATLAATHTRHWWLLVLPVIFFTATHVLLHAEARYRLPLTPLLCIFGAGGLVALLRPAWRASMTPVRWRLLCWSSAAVVVVYSWTGLLFLLG